MLNASGDVFQDVMAELVRVYIRLRSPAGALGLMQVMPRTERKTAKEHNLK